MCWNVLVFLFVYPSALRARVVAVAPRTSLDMTLVFSMDAPQRIFKDANSFTHLVNFSVQLLGIGEDESRAFPRDQDPCDR
jgi:hypothetical protein